MAQITAKELGALSDLMTIEENLVAKYNFFATQTTDSELKVKYEEIAMRHQRHYDELLSKLK